jgi:hypothetical protein
VGKNGREERVCCFYSGEERPRCLWWWRGALNGDWLGRAVSLRGLGPGVRGAHVLEGCGWPEVAGRTRRFVQSPQRAGVRRWWWRSNGQESRGGYASGVLGWREARVRERE